MFNLETAIATWRHSLTYRRTILMEDLDELERHVRDEVDAAVANGHSDETAFRKAMANMGDQPSIDAEYQKIFWGKLLQRRALYDELSWRFSMLKNYFKIAFRLLIKQRMYAFINIFGLAIGIAFCLLLLLYVRDEMTFDTQHENADRLVRVIDHENNNDGSVSRSGPWMPYPLGKALEADMSVVESAIRVYDRSIFVRSGWGTIREDILFADPSLLTAFTFPFVEGSAEYAFSLSNGVIISKKTAVKYFGQESALGKTLEFNFNNVYEERTITGVLEDIPANNSIRFDMLLPFELLAQKYDWIQTERWTASSFFVYALLQPGTDLRQADAQLQDLRRKYLPNNEVAQQRADGSWTNPVDPHTFAFQPIRDIHINPEIRSGLAPTSNPMYSWILGGIALTILLLACINFTTLSIGRSASRTREIALRKVVGAQRSQLIGQFGGEAALMSVLALALGLVMAVTLLPTFNELAGKELSLSTGGHWMIPLGLLGLGILVAVLSGFYPSLVLSRFQPTDMLRKQSRIGGSHRLTSGLVLFQFTLSIALIVGTSIMVRQMDFLQKADIGYDKDHVVLVRLNGQDGPKMISHFRSALQDRPEVEGITGMTDAFSHGWSRNGWTYLDKQLSAYVYRVEADFIDVMDIQLVDGRNFQAERALDSTKAVIINEAMARAIELENPVGEPLYSFGDDPEIIGVVKDFNFLSLRDEVGPMVFTINPEYSIGNILIQIRPESVPETIQRLTAAWNERSPEVPFEYSFLDDDLTKQYESESRWAKIIMYSSIFAIMIACLGLLGLAALSVAGRTKEIGIRRVMGASTASIVSLLSRSFIQIVFFAVVLAVPLSWFAASKWLDNFAYRIEIGYLVFIMAAVLTILVALLTVSFQTIRAANANPVESLKMD